jgi:hypothetical protein
MPSDRETTKRTPRSFDPDPTQNVDVDDEAEEIPGQKDFEEQSAEASQLELEAPTSNDVGEQTETKAGPPPTSTEALEKL